MDYHMNQFFTSKSYTTEQIQYIFIILLFSMQITQQNLLDAGIPKETIEKLVQFIHILISNGESDDELRIILEHSSLTNQQKQLVQQFIRQQYCREKDISESEFDATVLKNLGIGGLVGGTAVGAGGLGISALGFTTTGIAKASVAAGIQSSIGAVEAGSAFATLQSIGATGLLLNPVTIAASVTIGGLAGLGYYAFKKHSSQAENDNKKDNEGK